MQQHTGGDRCARFETLVEELCRLLHAAQSPDPKAFCDMLEALAIVTAALLAASRSEDSLDYFSRRLLHHIEALSDPSVAHRLGRSGLH